MYDVRLSRLPEVQVVPLNYIERIIWCQGSITRRSNMITSNKELLPPIRRCEDGRLRVVSAVGEKLQSEKRMSGAAFSQIDLDGVGIPFPVLRPHHDKIQSEASDDSFFSETIAHLCCFPSDQGCIGGVCRKDAPQVALPRRTTEELVMR